MREAVVAFWLMVNAVSLWVWVWIISLLCFWWLCVRVCGHGNKAVRLCEDRVTVSKIPIGNVYRQTHTVSLDPGGCFRCLHRRCRADNRLWQTSRHHLKAVTCWRIETITSTVTTLTQSRQGCGLTLPVVFRSVSTLQCFFIRAAADLRAASAHQRVLVSVCVGWSRELAKDPSLLTINLLCLTLKLLLRLHAQAKSLKTVF